MTEQPRRKDVDGSRETHAMGSSGAQKAQRSVSIFGCAISFRLSFSLCLLFIPLPYNKLQLNTNRKKGCGRINEWRKWEEYKYPLQIPFASTKKRGKKKERGTKRRKAREPQTLPKSGPRTRPLCKFTSTRDRTLQLSPLLLRQVVWRNGIPVLLRCSMNGAPYGL